MKKVFIPLTLAAMMAVAMLSPMSAEATKVKVQPSVTFRQSHVQSYHRPARVVRKVHPPVVVYDPYAPYGYEYYPAETYEYVEYVPPHRHRTSFFGCDFSLKFKFK